MRSIETGTRDRVASLFGEVGESPPARAIWSPARFIMLLVAACALLAARQPEGILAPQFFAEDGAVFFRGAFEHGLWDSLRLPHAGYPELVPRLLAELAGLFPLLAAPALYALFSLAIAAVSLCWIWLPHFRHLIPSDAARLYLVVLLLLAPNQEALMKLSYAQWYLCAWAALCCFMRTPRTAWGGVGVALGCIATFWTSPAAFVLLPLWALRAHCLEARPRRLAALTLLGGVAAVIAALIYPWGASMPADGPGMTLGLRFRGWLHGLTYKVVCSGALGEDLARAILSAGWPALYGTAVAAAAGLALLGSECPPSRVRLALASVYVILTTSALFVLRVPLVSGFAHGVGLEESGRYFFVATVFFMLSLVVLAMGAGARAGRLALGGILIIALHLPGFRMRSWTPRDFQWPRQVERIERARRGATLEGRAQTVVIPINPAPWKIVLRVRPESTR